MHTIVKMGIPGLLQLLKPVMTDVHLSALSGKRVAVDAYVWLHKGAFCCALELVEGKDTDACECFFSQMIHS